MKTCDHQSVGVIVCDAYKNLLLLTRTKPPAGRAPVAGHIDDHGSPHSAGVEGVFDEVGLHMPALELLETGYVANRCRRTPSNPDRPGHEWWIYRAPTVPHSVRVEFSCDETLGGSWFTPQLIDDHVRRTVAYAAGEISEAEWRVDPGLEPVWVYWLDRLGYLGAGMMGVRQLRLIVDLFTRAPA